MNLHDKWIQLRDLISKIGFKLVEHGAIHQGDKHGSRPGTARNSNNLLSPSSVSSSSSKNLIPGRGEDEHVMCEAGSDKFLMSK